MSPEKRSPYRARAYRRTTGADSMHALVAIARQEGVEGLDRDMPQRYTRITWQGRGYGGFLFKRLREHSQLNTVVDKAPVLSENPVLPCQAVQDIRWNGGFVMEKKCRTCGMMKPLGEFGKATTCIDGHRGQCNACGRESVNARQRTYRERHPEEVVASKRACRQRHYESNRAYNRNYRESHREDIATYTRAYSKAHSEKILSIRDTRRARKLNAFVERVCRTLVFERDGGRCHVCHKKAPRKGWHLDHLVPLSLGGEHSYKNVAVACPRCNLKRWNTGSAQLRLLGAC